MNYSRFLSSTAKLRKPQYLRLTAERLLEANLSPSDAMYMAGGLPNDALFPFASAHFRLKDETDLIVEGQEMLNALQYGPSAGYPPLLVKLKELVKHFHEPPTMDKPGDEGLAISAMPGSSEGIAKSLEMVLESGDYIITDKYTYTGALGLIQPMACKALPVANDECGMIPSELRKVMSKWKPSDANDLNSDIPKIMYLIPNGCNPTGATISTERRHEIYKIAREYNMLIIEDDPYFFIQFGEEKPPSFLSLDVDGRVIRIDSFSKVLSSGIRLGFVSGPAPLVRNMVLHTMVTTQHAASLSQVLVYQLLEKWGLEGFKNHTEKCSEFYRKQKDKVIYYAKKYLTGLAEWNEPSAGMFLWIKFNGIDDVRDLVSGKFFDNKLIVAPGYCFSTFQDKLCPYIRISYSLLEEEKVDPAFKCLAMLIREELETKNMDNK